MRHYMFLGNFIQICFVRIRYFIQTLKYCHLYDKISDNIILILSTVLLTTLLTPYQKNYTALKSTSKFKTKFL